MYFSTIREVGTTQVILPKPSQVRPIKPQPQQPGNGVQTQQLQSVQQTPRSQQQQQNNQQQVQQQNPNRLNAAALNKRQIPNGSTNTVNALRQAQKPLNIRK